MSFISLTFLIFLALTVLIYFIVPAAHRWLVLLAASLVFYGWAGIDKLLFAGISSLIVYFAALRMDAIYAGAAQETDKKAAAAAAKKKTRRILTGALVLLIGALVWTKAGASIAAAFSRILKGQPITVHVLVPMGISYYTFAVVGYLADVYWKKDKAEKNWLRLLLYMLFFPQIVQGPIPRHKKLAPQLAEGHPFDWERLRRGMLRVLWGYFKKMVIADRFAVIVTEVIGGYKTYEGVLFIAALAFSAVQLYCDFSGCMDIALGIAEMLGITLDENFRRPFLSRSAAEFWRRWHITLGTWFKDYVYMPLAVSPWLMKLGRSGAKTFGKRFGKSLMTAVPLAVVWLLTGLWHGTGPDYVVWGCYWGLLIIVTTVWAPEIRKLNEFLHIDTESVWWKRFQMVRTFGIFCVGRLLTITPDLKASAVIFRKILTQHNIWAFTNGTFYRLGLSGPNFWVGLFSLGIVWYINLREEGGSDMRREVMSYPLPVRWFLYYALFFAVLIFGMYGSGLSGGGFVYAAY